MTDYRHAVENLAGKCIVLAVTGGIAAYKAAELTRLLRKKGAEVRVIMTPHATEFVTPLLLQSLSDHPVISDMWTGKTETQIEHIHLADRADLVIVAPATANLMAKYAAGIADNFVTTFLLSVDIPVLLAPAMNPRMFQHPATRQNLETLKSRNVLMIGPDTGEVACKHVGEGRMSEPDAITDRASTILGRHGDLEHKTVLITAGPTREYLDPVRFISNKSSGMMGYSMAAAAVERGARVILVSGPSTLPVHHCVECIRVETGLQMDSEVISRIGMTDILIMTAAVSDWRCGHFSENKIKKENQDRLAIEFLPSTDILLHAAEFKKQHQIYVGFAAETGVNLQYAREKLLRKKLDLIVYNDVSRRDAGFDVSDNTGWMIDSQGNETELPLEHKRKMAERILDQAVKMMPR